MSSGDRDSLPFVPEDPEELAGQADWAVVMVLAVTEMADLVGLEREPAWLPVRSLDKGPHE